MAELEYAQVSEACVRKDLRVRVPLRPPLVRDDLKNQRPLSFFFDSKFDIPCPKFIILWLTTNVQPQVVDAVHHTVPLEGVDTALQQAEDTAARSSDALQDQEL